MDDASNSQVSTEAELVVNKLTVFIPLLLPGNVLAHDQTNHFGAKLVVLIILVRPYLR